MTWWKSHQSPLCRAHANVNRGRLRHHIQSKESAWSMGPQTKEFWRRFIHFNQHWKLQHIWNTVVYIVIDIPSLQIYHAVWAEPTKLTALQTLARSSTDPVRWNERHLLETKQCVIKRWDSFNDLHKLVIGFLQFQTKHFDKTALANRGVGEL